MSKKIKLGYALEQEGFRTGQEISIQPSHLLVTGLSQKAGKTTTLESLIKRSGRRAVVFRTKIGEHIWKYLVNYRQCCIFCRMIRNYE